MKEAENKHKTDDLTEDNTMNKLQHVGTLKHNNLFNTHVDSPIQLRG